jgi:hypothetical protein
MMQQWNPHLRFLPWVVDLNINWWKSQIKEI